MDINHTAVRTFDRLIKPVIVASNEAAEADHGFDAGEWSRAYHDAMLDREMDKYADIVGARFNMAGAELLRQWHEWAYLSEARMFDAIAHKCDTGLAKMLEAQS